MKRRIVLAVCAALVFAWVTIARAETAPAPLADFLKTASVRVSDRKLYVLFPNDVGTRLQSESVEVLAFLFYPTSVLFHSPMSSESDFKKTAYRLIPVTSDMAGQTAYLLDGIDRAPFAFKGNWTLELILLPKTGTFARIFLSFTDHTFVKSEEAP